METLDQILARQAAEEYTNEIQGILNPDTFSKETRDQAFEAIRQLGVRMSDKTVEFVKEMLASEIEGKSILFWKIYQQFLLSELELLRNFRDELDLAKREAQADLALDYAWLGDRIKDVYYEFSRLESVLSVEEQLLEGEPEEL